MLRTALLIQEIAVFNRYFEHHFFDRRFADKTVGLIVITNHHLSFMHLDGLTEAFQVFAIRLIPVAGYGLQLCFRGKLDLLLSLQVVMHLEVAAMAGKQRIGGAVIFHAIGE